MEPVRPYGGRWARIVTVPTDTPHVDQSLLDDLVWRGLVAHSTDLDALREALTAGSAHVLERGREGRHVGEGLVDVEDDQGRMRGAGHPSSMPTTTARNPEAPAAADEAG